MLAFIIVVVSLIVITGLCSIFAEKDAQNVHVAEYEKLIEMHEKHLCASPEKITEMKKTLFKIKQQYNLV